MNNQSNQSLKEFNNILQSLQAKTNPITHVTIGLEGAVYWYLKYGDLPFNLSDVELEHFKQYSSQFELKEDNEQSQKN